MSVLRPTLTTTTDAALPDPTAFYLIRDAVRSKPGLLHGKLNEDGRTCAIGAYFARNRLPIYTRVVDEVAAFNDSMPEVTARVRKQRVLRWLNWRLKILERGLRRK